MQGTAFPDQMRVHRDQATFPGPFPNVLVENHERGLRIRQAGDGVGRMHTAQSLIVNPVALAIDKDRCTNERVEIGIGPKIIVRQRIETDQMTVEAVQTD